VRIPVTDDALNRNICMYYDYVQNRNIQEVNYIVMIHRPGTYSILYCDDTQTRNIQNCIVMIHRTRDIQNCIVMIHRTRDIQNCIVMIHRPGTYSDDTHE